MKGDEPGEPALVGSEPSFRGSFSMQHATHQRGFVIQKSCAFNADGIV
jgi:hypothetical protein